MRACRGEQNSAEFRQNLILVASQCSRSSYKAQTELPLEKLHEAKRLPAES